MSPALEVIFKARYLVIAIRACLQFLFVLIVLGKMTLLQKMNTAPHMFIFRHTIVKGISVLTMDFIYLVFYTPLLCFHSVMAMDIQNSR